MPKTTTEETAGEQSGGDIVVRCYAQQVERALDEWRTRIDELKIQLDLANRDIRDEAHERLAATRNVYLAARSLTEATGNSDADLNSLVLRLEVLMRDLGDAYCAARDAVGGRREQPSVEPGNSQVCSDHDSL